jgi:hypothetical protein
MDDLLELEHAGWQSLCEGTGGQFYGELMTEDGRMVLANGSVMSRKQVVDALSNSPTWDSYQIEAPCAVPIDDAATALVYTGTGHRGDADPFVGVMTSVYVRGDDGWRLALYQQTPTT